MITTIKTHIIQIGNSQGIRIPKILLDQLNWPDDIELTIEEDQLIVRPVQSAVRVGWEQQFKIMAERGDDYLVDGDNTSLTDWDEEEWEWS